MNNNNLPFTIVQNLINQNIKYIAVYTNMDIYHLEKFGNGYKLSFEGNENPEDQGFVIQSTSQLKQFFKKHERITIIENDNQEVVWENKIMDNFYRQIHSYNIPGTVPNFNESECSICLESLSTGKINRQRLQCGHTYHKNCISQIRNNNCPMCRTSITTKYNRFGKVQKTQSNVSSSVSPSVSKKSLKGYLKNNPKKVGGALALLTTAATAAAIVASSKSHKKNNDLKTFTIKTKSGNLQQPFIPSHPASLKYLEDSEDPAPGVDSHQLTNFGKFKKDIIKNHINLLKNMKFN
jgi:hypothetical protein